VTSPCPLCLSAVLLHLDDIFFNLTGAMASMVALYLLSKLLTKISQEEGRIGDGVLIISLIKSDL
jgi:glycopeptide antibiotics resistance protein